MTYNPYPYTMYPQLNSYASYAQPQTPQTPAPTTQSQTQSGIVWVDGEVGAKAFQLPQGWPANTPMPLWDTNDTIIYLKSTNPMGMPNPLQRIHYRLEEQEAKQSGTSFRYPAAAPALMSGETEHPVGDFVTREDLEKMKAEIRETITEAMNSTQPTQKRGGKNESAV